MTSRLARDWRTQGQPINQRITPFGIVPALDVLTTRRIGMLLAEARVVGLMGGDSVTFDNADDAIACLETL